MMGSPTATEAPTFSARRRQQFTRTRRVSPSTQRLLSLSKRRDVDATRKLATSVLLLVVRRHSGAVSPLPTTTIGVSYMIMGLSGRRIAVRQPNPKRPRSKSRAVDNERLWITRKRV